MLSRIFVICGCAAVVVAAAAGPASAEVDSAQTIESTVDSGTHPAGVCVGWGSAVTVTTVYNPLSPPAKLATVAVPLVTSVKAC
jgi:hypothetical protein